MSNFMEELEQVKSILGSNSKSEKAYAYLSLQNLQQQSTIHNSLITSLSISSLTILSSILADIHSTLHDDEIVSLALKCLGFMIYHPSIVPTIPNRLINEVLESLARLITTTKIKVVCNLGVWCISMQQIDASLLVLHFDSLLRSVVHSLDNPVGSLSTTFEGIQAVMKLGAQVSENMRDSSTIWAPPIYRRLLSADKRERDMCQRCLLKLKCLIIPPEQALSKAIAHEIKLRLLPAMKELLKQGKKIQALQAWRWFICILGYHSLKSRHLVNELLKVPEQTFSDSDPQVQIATLVAWEGLIDALVALPSEVCDTKTISQPLIEHDKVKLDVTSGVNGGLIQTGAYIKRLKLIMTPIIEIMASKTDFSVQSSCLNTWYYLLHKLDSLVNDPCILHTVVEPMFKAVFNFKLDDRNIWIWKVCINLLHDFIRSKTFNSGSRTESTGNSSPRTTNHLSPLSGNSTLRTYSVEWLPWDFNQMDFPVRMIQMTFSQAAVATLSSESNNLVYDFMLKMFRNFLKGVQIDFAKSPTSYDTIMQSINAVLGLVKTVCEAVLCVDGESSSFQATCLRSLEALIQELDPSIFGSLLYKVPFDVEYVFQGESRCRTLVGSVSTDFMDMVSPVTYLTVLYYHVVVQVNSKSVSHEFTLQEASSFLSNVLSAYELLDVLHAIVTSLYAIVDNRSLGVWISVAHSLKDHLYSAKDLLPLKIHPTSSGSNTFCKFLIYPLAVYSICKSMGTPKQCSSEKVIDVWMSLYSCVNCTILHEFPRTNWFTEDLCSLLIDFLHQQSNSCEGITVVNDGDKCIEHQLLSLFGDIGKCILENLHIEKVTPEAIKCSYTGSSGINYCLEFIARLMNLVWTKMEEASKNAVIFRLLPPFVHVVGRFQWKDDITTFVKVFGEPMVLLMSGVGVNAGEIKDEMSVLWAEVIRSLQRSWPSIEFDSSFLKLQAHLLEKTFEHPSQSISEATIKFWNSSYGEEPDLAVPPCLSPVLEKLSRLGKIKIRNRKAARLVVEDEGRARMRGCSKRVEGVKNGMVDGCGKRKRSEVTEHQREVRRAQQGKARDSSGHGPGIRTYTKVDLSYTR